MPIENELLRIIRARRSTRIFTDGQISSELYEADVRDAGVRRA
jgi:hypothetical protein